MFEYDKDSQHAAEQLDNYDLTDILDWCFDANWRDPWDIKKEYELNILNLMMFWTI